MRIVLYFAAFIITTLGGASYAQNCNRNTTGLPPISDLGTGFYQGLQGGLYPAGQNTRPAGHDAAGITIADQIVPLDADGNVDLTSGKIVLMSIGMSNTRQEFDSLETAAAAYADKNPQVVLVNGAQDGKDIDMIIRPGDTFWANAMDSLASAGVTDRQVQVIWDNLRQYGVAGCDNLHL